MPTARNIIKAMTKISDEEILKKAASIYGRRGGLAVSKNRKHMRKIAKLGAKARWSNKGKKEKITNQK